MENERKKTYNEDQRIDLLMTLFRVRSRIITIATNVGNDLGRKLYEEYMRIENALYIETNP